MSDINLSEISGRGGLQAVQTIRLSLEQGVSSGSQSLHDTSVHRSDHPMVQDERIMFPVMPAEMCSLVQ